MNVYGYVFDDDDKREMKNNKVNFGLPLTKAMSFAAAKNTSKCTNAMKRCKDSL